MIRRHAVVGFALGVAWGVAARIWMRMVSTSPEFSWDGTLTIIGGAGVVGLCFGVATGADRAGRSRWWRLCALPSILLLAGPGAVFAPALLLGGWSLAGRGPRWVRVVVGSLGLLSPPVLGYLLESTDPSVLVPRTTQIVLGAGLLGLAVAAGARGAFRRSMLPGGAVFDSGGNGGQAVPRAAHRLSRSRPVTGRP